MRIGLLGGSFNPAHEAHRRISIAALKRLGLDQVWWLVSPGNPLKQNQKAPSLGKRVAAAREVARHPKIVVTGFEGATGERLHDRHHPLPQAALPVRQFRVADGRRQSRRLSSLAVVRGDFQARAHRRVRSARLSSEGAGEQSGAAFRLRAVDELDARGLAGLVPPAWTVLTLPLSPLSSTGLRGEAPKPEAKAEKGQVRQSLEGREEGGEAGERKAAKKASKPDRKQVKKPGQGRQGGEGGQESGERREVASQAEATRRPSDTSY